MRTLCLVLPLLVAGCIRPGQEPAPLERQTFVAVYADLEATLWKTTRGTSDTIALGRAADSIFAEHHVTRAQYLATLQWYDEDLGRWKGFYDEAGKILEERSRTELMTVHGSP